MPERPFKVESFSSSRPQSDSGTLDGRRAAEVSGRTVYKGLAHFKHQGLPALADRLALPGWVRRQDQKRPLAAYAKRRHHAAAEPA